MSLISDVIDFSQADDGAIVAYGLSEQLDDLKVTCGAFCPVLLAEDVTPSAPGVLNRTTLLQVSYERCQTLRI